MKALSFNLQEPFVKEFSIDGRFRIFNMDGRITIMPVNDGQGLIQNDAEPQFKHDCVACIFLGKCYEGRNYDLYFCPQYDSPTVIARYGDNGPEYISGLVFAETIKPIARAKEIATALGLIK